MSNTLVELRSIHKTFGNVVAVDTVDLSISRGEFVVLLGPSGSGKTTILAMLGGFLTPSSGQIFIEAPSRPKSAPFVATRKRNDVAFVGGLSHASLVGVKKRADVWDPSEKPHLNEGTSTKCRPITVSKTPPFEGADRGATRSTDGVAS